MLAVALFVLACDASSGNGFAQQPLSIDEVINGLEKYENALLDRESFHIIYELVRSENVIAAQYPDARALAEYQFAYNKSKTISIRRFTHPFTIKGVKFPGEPITYLVNHGMYVEWDSSRNFANLDSLTQPYDNLSNGHEYTKNLGFDAYKNITKMTGKTLEMHRESCSEKFKIPFLLESLRANKSSYRVSNDTIEINGMRCWKVEWPGMDSFAIDPTRGFIVPQRVIHWAPNEPKRYEFLQRDYREVSPGFWLPFAQTKKTYASKKEAKELWGRVVSEHEYLTRSIILDNVPDTIFELKLPAKSIVIDHTQDIHYRVPKAGADPFERALEDAKPFLLRQSPLRIIIILAIVSLVVFYFFLRRRRVSAARPPKLGGKL